MKIGALSAGWRVIRPIRTPYRGITFRSTLEADWAATLDSLGIDWLYEPQGLTLRSGQMYRPDFYLPTIGTWLEVKGPGIPGAEKAIELAEAVRCTCLGFDIHSETHGDDSRDWRFATDACECEWSGGEQVVIGLAPKPGDLHEMGGEGYASWVNASGPPLDLITCVNCKANWWLERCDRSRSVGCRSCYALTDGDPWGLSGEVPFARAPRKRRFPFKRGH